MIDFYEKFHTAELSFISIRTDLIYNSNLILICTNLKQRSMKSAGKWVKGKIRN